MTFRTYLVPSVENYFREWFFENIVFCVFKKLFLLSEFSVLYIFFKVFHNQKMEPNILSVFFLFFLFFHNKKLFLHGLYFFIQ